MFHHATSGLRALSAGVFALGLVACGSDAEVNDPQATEGAIVGMVSLSDGEAPEGVLVATGAHSATTADDGTFRFEDISAGAVLVSASLEGYRPAEAFITVIAGQDNAVRLVLEPRSAGPQILRLSADISALAPGEQTAVRVEAIAPEGGSLDVSWSATGGFEVEADSDDPFSATLTAPDEADAAGEVTVTVTDSDDRQAEESVSVSTVGNAAPQIASISADAPVVARAGQISLSVVANDADGDALTYAWSAPEGWELNATDQATVVATAPDAPGDVGSFSVLVSDAQGAQASAQLSVSTAQNQAPRIRSATALPAEVLPGTEIDLQAEAIDPEGDALLYEWLVPEGWEVSSVVGARTTLTAPDTYGTSGRITLIVSDDFGATDQTELVVSTLTNQGPSISSLITTRPIATPGELVFLEAIASHPYEDALTYSWEATGGFSVITDNRPVSAPALRAPDQENAVGTVRLTVSDSAGVTAQAALVVQTRSYAAPIINSITAISPADFGDSALVSVSARDPEDGDLSYAWTSTNGNIVILTPSSRTTEILGGNPDEVVVLTVEVTNSAGKTTRGETRVRFPGI
ncbi:carboxypeptidase regulatory-like domain-containing protein [Bradymonadaceae bacterium TMQ3]|nr:carboxypeptidase regulatory-like domain-containing protein [Bradymonadaceae bacterium TMQ3]TXC75128.1 carboxypeptidase regulatory-like domain-containing protein [Bradymonadales bacterium TMQ1]